MKAEQRDYVRSLPDQLEPVKSATWPQSPAGAPRPIEVWRSRYYLVQVFKEKMTPAHPDLLRLSINRTTVKADLKWNDGITWDALQQIKREIGLGEWWGVEVYPPDVDIVNVANIRHIWCSKYSFGVGWVREEADV